MAREDFTGSATLVVGTIKGMRTFDISSAGKLYGLTYPYEWEPGENVALHGLETSDTMTRSMFSSMWEDREFVEAGHFQGVPWRLYDEDEHNVESCRCGFYGYTDLEGEVFGSGHNRVSGVIEGWGETVVGPRGFRSNKAKIVALCVPKKSTMSKLRWNFDWLARWANRPSGNIGSALIPVSMFVSILGFVVGGWIADTATWGLIPCFAAIFLGVYIMNQAFRAIAYEFPTVNEVANPYTAKCKVTLLQEKYPGVPIYRTQAEMLAAVSLG